MRYWSYEIRDNDSHKILRTDTGFESESDAEQQAKMEANAENIKNFYVRTIQPPCKDERN